MGWILKTAAVVLANILIFMLSTRVVPGFMMAAGFGEMLVIALIFTGLNYILKPVLKLLLGPIIVLTLGLGLILVNMVVLFILDKLSNNLTIENALALVYSSVLIGFLNFLLHLVFRKK
ncbi:MAG: phage holin family protein [Patescibacteria group bacterium]